MMQMQMNFTALYNISTNTPLSITHITNSWSLSPSDRYIICGRSRLTYTHNPYFAREHAVHGPQPGCPSLPPPGLRPCVGESNRTNRFESKLSWQVHVPGYKRGSDRPRANWGSTAGLKVSRVSAGSLVFSANEGNYRFCTAAEVINAVSRGCS